MSERTADLAVVGSGGAALVAAITAASAGLRVTVVESSSTLGGTTALSGGLIYAPGNSIAADLGYPDDPDEIRRYLRSVARRPLDEVALDSFLETIPAVIDFLGDKGVRLRASALPDYHREAPGAGAYRAVAPQPFDPVELGSLATLVRRTPYRPVPDDEPWTNGMAVIGHLLTACRALNVSFETGWRATELVREAGAVVGVRGLRDGEEVEHRCPAGVVLAGGGFEFDPKRVNEHVADLEASWSCPGNIGDGLRMALEAGAAFGQVDVQWYPLLRLTERQWDGAPLMDDASPARNLPGSLVVDATGRRFTNEGAMYQDFGRSIAEAAGPCWLIMDEAFIERYRARAFGDTEPVAGRWFTAPTAEDLARMIGVDAEALRETLRRFNKSAADGADPDFDRGQSAFDQSWGDDTLTGPRACLAPLGRPSFHATRIYAGSSGTTGGPMIDGNSRVLDDDGSPILGLFAAGNTVANPFGGTAPGSGGTLGPGFTTGYLAGRSAAGSR